MAGSYASSKVVYKELRDTIGPWAKAQGFARRPGTAAGWQDNLDADRVLYFQFEVSWIRRWRASSRETFRDRLTSRRRTFAAKCSTV